MDDLLIMDQSRGGIVLPLLVVGRQQQRHRRVPQFFRRGRFIGLDATTSNFQDFDEQRRSFCSGLRVVLLYCSCHGVVFPQRGICLLGFGICRRRFSG